MDSRIFIPLLFVPALARESHIFHTIFFSIHLVSNRIVTRKRKKMSVIQPFCVFILYLIMFVDKKLKRPILSHGRSGRQCDIEEAKYNVKAFLVMQTFLME